MKKISILIVFVISHSVIASAQKAHPYLFYTNDRVNALKKKIKADPVMLFGRLLGGSGSKRLTLNFAAKLFQN